MKEDQEKRKKHTASHSRPISKNESVHESNNPDGSESLYNTPGQAGVGTGAQSGSSESLEEIDMVSIPATEFADLQSELQTAQKQASEYFDGWQRERADLSNYRKRIEREQGQLSQTISGSIIKKYLVILDDLERALKTRPAQGDGAAWADGVELIYRKLQKILEAEGVQRIPAESEMFDPNRHEAITHEDSSDHQSGQIIEVVQQGFTLGDRVLRPALVRVAR
jgi:molecular chaperone GrpE